jgi:hypothetical protein
MEGDSLNGKCSPNGEGRDSKESTVVMVRTEGLGEAFLSLVGEGGGVDLFRYRSSSSEWTTGLKVAREASAAIESSTASWIPIVFGVYKYG